MSAVAYAALTRQREGSPPGTSESANKPGVSTWLDAVVALVPAEVLAIHALILNWTTKTDKDAEGQSVTTITDPGGLKVAFWLLLFLAPTLYFLKKKSTFDWLDLFRAGITSISFGVWTMLQQTTAFDATFPDVPENTRYIIAVVLAAAVVAAAKRLAMIADQEDPG